MSGEDDDFRVTQTSPPGCQVQVHIAAGSGVHLSIGPTSSTRYRFDLVVLRGVALTVIQDVPAEHPEWGGQEGDVPLAVVTLPFSTGVVMDRHITDLRTWRPL